MIPVTLNVLLFIYLGLMLGLIFGAWLLSSWGRARREKRAFRHIVRCSMCAHQFEDKNADLLARCPRCASLNERYRLSRL